MIAGVNRRRLLKPITACGISEDSDRWLTSLEDDVVSALRELDESTAIELSGVVPVSLFEVVSDEHSAAVDQQ